MHFATRSFLGSTTKNFWCQFWENEPDDRDLYSKRGHLFALVSLESSADFDIAAAGHAFIENFNQLYFGDVTKPIAGGLTDAIEAAITNLDAPHLQITLSLSIITADDFYTATYNTSQTIIRRQTSISKILIGDGLNSKIIKGRVVPGDLILLSTAPFVANLGWDKVKSTLALSSIQEIEEDFLSALYSQDSQDGMAALLIQINGDSTFKDIASQEVEPEPTPPLPSPKKSAPSIFTKLFSRRAIYVPTLDNHSQTRKKRFNIIVGIVVLILLGCSIYLGSVRNQKQRLESQYQSLKSEYQIKIDNALAVKNINLKEAQQEAAAAKKILEQMAVLHLYEDDVKNFTAKADQILAQTGSANYAPIELYDTTLINSNASYNFFVMQNNLLTLFDSEHGFVDQLTFPGKSQKKLISKSDLVAATSFSQNESSSYFLKNGQISSITGDKIESKITPKDGQELFTSGTIYFWNSSLYLLSHLTDGTATIWKYAPSSSGFGQGQSWLKKSDDLPSDTSSLAINGQVWALTKKGEIISFNLGTKTSFKLKNKLNLNNAGNLVINKDSNLLAFTDNDNLVYLYNLTSENLQNYNFGSLRIFSLALDESGQQLLILCSDKKIYKISL